MRGMERGPIGRLREGGGERERERKGIIGGLPCSRMAILYC